ncbi:MAG: S9 family peptidase [Bacteroidetes bacterium]|nr:MAG: S9 family peptidase [Bacteroidota bacterium]
MKKSILLTLALGMGTLAIAQKNFTMQDAITGASSYLAPKRVSGLNWMPQSHTWIQSFEEADKAAGWVLSDADKGTKDTLKLVDLNRALMVFNSTLNRQDPLPIFDKMPSIHSWANNREARFMRKNMVYRFDLVSKTLMVEHDMDLKAANKDFHESTGNVAYTLDNNLWVKPYGTAAKPVTNDLEKGIVNGQSVHRNEFGIHKGTFWSDNGEKLAYYRMDESMVTEYPIYDLHKMPAQADMIRYPFAGAKSHHVTLHVYDVKSGKTIQIQTGEPKEQYLTNIAWSPDGEEIFIAIVNRDQNEMKLVSFDAKTGKQKAVLFTETHPKYVEPENPMHWLSNKEFIWESERDGFNHLYLYKRDGKLVKQLTSGDWMVTEYMGTDNKGKKLYFMSTKQSPLNQNLYSVEVSNGKLAEITKINGVHSCKGASDKSMWLDQYSNPETPYAFNLISNEGKKVDQQFLAEDPLKYYNLGQTEVLTLKSTDGTTDLYARITKPVNFDPKKKYPVVVYVYGGPHLQLVTNRWMNGANLWTHYMAQQGFIVFTLDNRGSSNRGLNFENATHRQLGTLEMADQLRGVEYLKSLAYVDAERMGVHGWSFGGFMTTSLMTRQAGTFKVGVAGGPVIDWSMYEIMYTERYMDRPEENPEGFKNNNLLNYTENLKGKLMLIHGTSDDVVLWQHSLLYVQKCVKEGVQLDYFVYPEHAHNVRGKDREHLMQKVSDYLIENLKN